MTSPPNLARGQPGRLSEAEEPHRDGKSQVAGWKRTAEGLCPELWPVAAQGSPITVQPSLLVRIGSHRPLRILTFKAQFHCRPLLYDGFSARATSKVAPRFPDYWVSRDMSSDLPSAKKDVAPFNSEIFFENTND